MSSRPRASVPDAIGDDDRSNLSAGPVIEQACQIHDCSS
jgi:hypothetical protein